MRDEGKCNVTCSAQGGGGGGGGILTHLVFMRRPGPSIYCLPQKISGISNTPRKYLKFLHLQKYPDSVYLPSEKTIKYTEITLKLVQFLDDPKKYPQNFHTPKNVHFSEAPKILKFKILNPQK